ncbi:MAG: hypothetical protein R3C56_18665 [Pirellulaceae bacterium]
MSFLSGLVFLAQYTLLLGAMTGHLVKQRLHLSMQPLIARVVDAHGQVATLDQALVRLPTSRASIPLRLAEAQAWQRDRARRRADRCHIGLRPLQHTRVGSVGSVQINVPGSHSDILPVATQRSANWARPGEMTSPGTAPIGQTID